MSTFSDFNIDLGGWRFKATLDQLDNVFIPRHGNFVEVNGFFSRVSWSR